MPEQRDLVCCIAGFNEEKVRTLLENFIFVICYGVPLKNIFDIPNKDEFKTYIFSKTNNSITRQTKSRFPIADFRKFNREDWSDVFIMESSLPWDEVCSKIKVIIESADK